MARKAKVLKKHNLAQRRRCAKCGEWFLKRDMAEVLDLRPDGKGGWMEIDVFVCPGCDRSWMDE